MSVSIRLCKRGSDRSFPCVESGFLGLTAHLQYECLGFVSECFAEKIERKTHNSKEEIS